MLGLDTNVLIRYLVRDDLLQYEKARRLIHREAGHGEPVLVSLLVLLEVEWVLRSRYQLAKTEIVATLSALLAAADLMFEDEPFIESALYAWKDAPADFADCLIEARNRRLGCRATASFDGKALRLASLVPVWMCGASRKNMRENPPAPKTILHVSALPIVVSCESYALQSSPS